MTGPRSDKFHVRIRMDPARRHRATKVSKWPSSMHATGTPCNMHATGTPCSRCTMQHAHHATCTPCSRYTTHPGTPCSRYTMQHAHHAAGTPLTLVHHATGSPLPLVHHSPCQEGHPELPALSHTLQQQQSSVMGECVSVSACK